MARDNENQYRKSLWGLSSIRQSVLGLHVFRTSLQYRLLYISPTDGRYFYAPNKQWRRFGSGWTDYVVKLMWIFLNTLVRFTSFVHPQSGFYGKTFETESSCFKIELFTWLDQEDQVKRSTPKPLRDEIWHYGTGTTVGSRVFLWRPQSGSRYRKCDCSNPSTNLAVWFVLQTPTEERGRLQISSSTLNVHSSSVVRLPDLKYWNERRTLLSCFWVSEGEHSSCPEGCSGEVQITVIVHS